MDGPDPSRRTNTPCSVPLSSSGTSSPPDHQACTSTGAVFRVASSYRHSYCLVAIALLRVVCCVAALLLIVVRASVAGTRHAPRTPGTGGSSATCVKIAL